MLLSKSFLCGFQDQFSSSGQLFLLGLDDEELGTVGDVEHGLETHFVFAVELEAG